MIELRLAQKAMDDIAKDLEATPREIKRAFRLTLNEVGRAMKSIAAKELSKDTGIKRKVLKPRVLLFRRRTDSGEQAKLWAGLYRIPGRKAGARRVSGGVRVGNQVIPGAFVINGTPYRRVHGKKQAVKVDISPQAQAVLDADVIPLFEARFMDVFERKLRWLKE